MESRRARQSLLVSAALVLLMVLGACGSKKTKRTSTVPVSVAIVERRAVPFEIEATGTVEPQQTVEVVAQVGGTVKAIGFREGEPVRQGQVLFQLDARPIRAALEEARAVLARDRARADQARRLADRARMLRDQTLISAEEFEDKRALADAALATLQADSAAVSQAQYNLLHATIRAPITGRTGRLRIHVGDVVKPSDSETPMVTINQMHPVRVRFAVPQDALPAVLRSRHGPLRVRVSPTDPKAIEHDGRLVFVDNAVDDATGTLLLKGEFENKDESLWPGAFVRVRLVLASDPDATVVPGVAVTTGPEGPFVYVVAADSTVSVRPVVMQRTHDELAVITHGLEAGEMVVTDGQLRLGPGARVVIRPSATTSGTRAPTVPETAPASTPAPAGGTR
jgi:multidrug efflux system membrane fusion protein